MLGGAGCAPKVLICCKLSLLPHFITGGRLPDDVHKEDGEIGHGATLRSLETHSKQLLQGGYDLSYQTISEQQ